MAGAFLDVVEALRYTKTFTELQYSGHALQLQLCKLQMKNITRIHKSERRGHFEEK